MTSSASAYPLSKGSSRSSSSPFLHILYTPLKLIPRPSVRLKSALYLLSTTIIIIVILALNAARTTSTAKTTEAILNTVPVHDSLSSGEGQAYAQGKDGHLIDEEIQRSFEEPDFGLLSGRQPHDIRCDVPLEGDEGERGVLLFLGIFSAGNKRGRRDLYRETILPDFPKSLVTAKFILGIPPFVEDSWSEEAKERTKLVNELDMENREHGDMVILPMIDNIDLGKTHEYFKWVAKEFEGPARVKGRPRFVMKADDDTILVMPNVFSTLKDLNCAKNIYWGTSAGISHYFTDYFRGLAYALSWPLVSWIGNAEMPLAHMIKIEDARTGQWLKHLNPLTDPITRIDLGWTMGDWNQLDVTIETVALHWIKLDGWVKEQHDRLLSIWSTSNRAYTPETGIPRKQIIEKGKQTPEGALRENQRQKELGWDVDGNEGFSGGSTGKDAKMGKAEGDVVVPDEELIRDRKEGRDEVGD